MRHSATAMLWFAVAAAVLAGISAGQAADPNSAPNPYHVVEHWAKLPEGRVWGQAIGVDIDRDGTSLWVFDRCGGKSCAGSDVAPIQKFDASGDLVASFDALPKRRVRFLIRLRVGDVDDVVADVDPARSTELLPFCQQISVLIAWDRVRSHGFAASA